jgi:hypothetical protein
MAKVVKVTKRRPDTRLVFELIFTSDGGKSFGMVRFRETADSTQTTTVAINCLSAGLPDGIFSFMYFGQFLSTLEGKMLVYFMYIWNIPIMYIWYILWPFWKFCMLLNVLVYCVKKNLAALLVSSRRDVE